MKFDLLIRQVCIHNDEPLMDIAVQDGRIAAIEAGIEGKALSGIDTGGRMVRIVDIGQARSRTVLEHLADHVTPLGG